MSTVIFYHDDLDGRAAAGFECAELPFPMRDE